MSAGCWSRDSAHPLAAGIVRTSLDGSVTNWWRNLVRPCAHAGMHKRGSSAADQRSAVTCWTSLQLRWGPSAGAASSAASRHSRLAGRIGGIGLTTTEREVLTRLRRENRVLREEREILAKPRPGSLRRPARRRHGVRLRKGQPGHARDCHDVPRTGRLRQRLLRAAQAAADGVPLCVTVTLADRLVLARLAFHHSINNRSVVILGNAIEITNRAEKVAAMRRLALGRCPGAIGGGVARYTDSRHSTLRGVGESGRRTADRRRS